VTLSDESVELISLTGGFGDAISRICSFVFWGQIEFLPLKGFDGESFDVYFSTNLISLCA
jgi:hypothetical protein